MKNIKHLTKIILVGFLFTLFPFTNVNAISAKGPADNPGEMQTIQNVIYMIGDGLGLGQMEIARALEYGKDGEFHMEQLDDIGLLKTYSNDMHATDSGAAGSAMATGYKTNNGMISMTPDGDSVQTILEAFKEDGKSTGIISTHSIADATPAAFTAHVDNRNEYEEIIRQQYEAQFDVLLGGGRQYLMPEAQDGNNLIEAYQEDGYQYVQNRDELLNADTPEKLLGLFAEGHFALVTDRQYLDEEVPTLPEMTEAALDVLAQNEDGFFLMVEGSRIDHAAHYGDATNVWLESVEFDDTVALVQEWAADRDDTLILVTADHETMGMSVPEMMNVEDLQKITASPEYMVSQLELDEENNQFTEESIRAVFSEHTAIDLSDEDMERLNTHFYDDEGEPRSDWDVAVEMGLVISEYNHVGVFSRELTELSDSTSGHSGNMVPIFATGTGSEYFNAVLDNTDLPRIIAELANVDFSSHYSKSDRNESNEEAQTENSTDDNSSSSNNGSNSGYRIVWGDTLWGIAQEHDTDVKSLATENNIENPDLIFAGDWLTIIPGYGK